MKTHSTVLSISLVLVAALALAACQPMVLPAAPAPTAAATSGAAAVPSVTVSDQPIANGTVTIGQVVSKGPGWLVIHIDANGNPGPVIGYAPVVDGMNMSVVVKIDASKATPTLYAMLHIDAGKVGTYEFPGPDVPVMLNGQMVSPAFKVQSSSGSSTGTTSSGVDITNFKFSPAQLTVTAGTTVTWTNKDSTAHTVTADDGSFDSGNLATGATFQFTFTKPGTYAYHCAYHKSMVATIIVTAAP